MIRKKKNTERYAVLWDRTIQAIKEYLEIRPEPQKGYEDHVFISKEGLPLKSDNLSDDYRAFIKKVNKVKAEEAEEAKEAKKSKEAKEAKKAKKVKEEDLSAKVAVPKELTFKFFRKSAASSAERTPGANPSEVSYLMGHSIGIRRYYTYRAADLVGNVCKKIEEDFFGVKAGG